MDWILMVTFGLAFSKSATVCFQNAAPGPVVELCQKVMVTLPSVDELSSPLPLQPVASNAVPAARASRLATRIFLFIVETPW